MDIALANAALFSVFTLPWMTCFCLAIEADSAATRLACWTAVSWARCAAASAVDSCGDPVPVLQLELLHDRDPAEHRPGVGGGEHLERGGHPAVHVTFRGQLADRGLTGASRAASWRNVVCAVLASARASVSWICSPS